MKTLAKTTLDALIKLADAHQKADEYRAGQYEWSGGACAIGCTIHDAKKIGIAPKSLKPGDHAGLAKYSGVPQLVWRLADSGFERINANARPAWTPTLLRAIKPNHNYAGLDDRICARLMLDPVIGLVTTAIREDVRAVAVVISGLYARRAKDQTPPSDADWWAAYAQAGAAYAQAWAVEAFWTRIGVILCEELSR